MVFIILKTIYSGDKNSFISESFDAILFELIIVASGAFLSSSIIGIIFEKFQTKVINDDSLIRKRYIDEGILRIFESATDPQLLNFLKVEINNSNSEVIGLGLGLGILSHNPKIMGSIAKKINSVPNYRLRIFLGSSENIGVNNRIKEEKDSIVAKGLNYDETWIKRYPSEIKGLLNKDVSGENQKKYKVKEIDTCPMVSIIKIDNYFLYFSYGSPDIKGSDSPWILVDGKSQNSAIVRYLKKVLEFYE